MPVASIINSTDKAASIIPMILVRREAPPFPMILIMPPEKSSNTKVTIKTANMVADVTTCS